MSVTIANIDNPGNDERAGNQIKHKIWILPADSYDSDQAFPSRDSNRQVANIPLKSGKYWYYMEMVIDSPELKFNAEEGEIASVINNELSGVAGGMGKELLQLLETGIGEHFFVVVQFCGTSTKYLLGSDCRPAKLSNFEGGATKDNTSVALSFKNKCTKIWAKYTGNTPDEDPDTVAADETTIALTSNPRYQLTDGSASAVSITSFTGTSASDVGRIVTILGSGGDYPSTIEDGSDFLLKDGETWTANANAQISFEIFKDGASSYKYVEVSGSRIS